MSADSQIKKCPIQPPQQPPPSPSPHPQPSPHAPSCSFDPGGGMPSSGGVGGASFFPGSRSIRVSIAATHPSYDTCRCRSPSHVRCFTTRASNGPFGIAPITWSTSFPSRKNRSVGMPITPNSWNFAWFSSLLIFANTTLPAYFLASSSIVGAIAWQGRHHSAQKSTTTYGFSFTTRSKSASVMWIGASWTMARVPRVRRTTGARDIKLSYGLSKRGTFTGPPLPPPPPPPPPAAEPLPLHDVERLPHPRVPQRPEPGEDHESVEHVVVPVQRVVELEPLRVDHVARLLGAKQAMAEEHLSRALRGHQRVAVPRRAIVLQEAPHRRAALVERGVVRARVLVAVPPTVGPLPVHEESGELAHALVPRHPKAARDAKRVPLLGGACPHTALEDDDPLPVRGAPQPPQDLIRRAQCGGMTRGQAELDQGHEPPVGARPLLVWVHAEPPLPPLPP